jgi:hypothetical protein
MIVIGILLLLILVVLVIINENLCEIGKVLKWRLVK